jgi:hypothetical protein
VFMPRPDWTTILLCTLPELLGWQVFDTTPYYLLLVELGDGSHKFFIQAGLEPESSWSLPIK